MRHLAPTRETLASIILSTATPAMVKAGQRASFATFDDDLGADKQETVTISRVANEEIADVGHLAFDVDDGNGSAAMGSITIEAPL